jgi:hypothetical protein
MVTLSIDLQNETAILVAVVIVVISVVLLSLNRKSSPSVADIKVSSFNPRAHISPTLKLNPTNAYATAADAPNPERTPSVSDIKVYPVKSCARIWPTLKLNPTDGYATATDAPNPEGGACYLVYETDSSGRLVEQYSKTPIVDAIGRWTPGGGKKIAGFKFKQNLGKSVLIGNCAAGVQGRKNYSSGWCQFIRSARVMHGEVMLWNPVAKGLMVDVYLYTDDNRPMHQTYKLKQGVVVDVQKPLAVACIPKGTSFYGSMTVDIFKWLADGSNYGASIKFKV